MSRVFFSNTPSESRDIGKVDELTPFLPHNTRQLPVQQCSIWQKEASVSVYLQRTTTPC